MTHPNDPRLNSDKGGRGPVVLMLLLILAALAAGGGLYAYRQYDIAEFLGQPESRDAGEIDLASLNDPQMVEMESQANRLDAALDRMLGRHELRGSLVELLVAEEGYGRADLTDPACQKDCALRNPFGGETRVVGVAGGHGVRIEMTRLPRVLCQMAASATHGDPGEQMIVNGVQLPGRPNCGAENQMTQIESDIRRDRSAAPVSVAALRPAPVAPVAPPSPAELGKQLQDIAEATHTLYAGSADYAGLDNAALLVARVVPSQLAEDPDCKSNCAFRHAFGGKLAVSAQPGNAYDFRIAFGAVPKSGCLALLAASGSSPGCLGASVNNAPRSRRPPASICVDSNDLVFEFQ